MILEKAGNYHDAANLCVCCDMLQCYLAVVARTKSQTAIYKINTDSHCQFTNTYSVGS